MSHIRVRHVPRTNRSFPTYEWAMSHIRMSHVPNTNESCHTSGALTKQKIQADMRQRRQNGRWAKISRPFFFSIVVDVWTNESWAHALWSLKEMIETFDFFFPKSYRTYEWVMNIDCKDAESVQPIAFGVSSKLNPQSQSHWSLFNGTWKRDLEN